MELLYLDNSATSWPKPKEVLESIRKAIEQYGANPGRSGHKLAIEAARIIYETREALAELFGLEDPERVILTKNVTEALNLVLYGFLKPGDHVITSSMEHNSVMRPLRDLEKKGVEVTQIRASEKGEIDPQDVLKSIRKNTKLIVLVHLSNVTGTIMPVEEVLKISKDHGIPLLLDAAQSAGTIPINLKELPVDLLAFTGHKGLFGPQGTGGLIINTEGLEERIEPLMRGGTGSKSEEEEQPEFLPDKYESGTPNTPGIAGLGEGVRFILKEGIERIREKKEKLTLKLIEGLKEIKGVKLYGPLDPKKQIGIVSFNLEGKSPSEVSHLLDEKYNILSRPGLHCAPSAHKSIGTFPFGTVRFSLGYFNTEEEIEYAIRAVRDLVGSK
jgi:cysteine desulfurase/selenocysteine lyase